MKDYWDTVWNGISPIANAFWFGLVMFWIAGYISDPGISGLFITAGIVFLARSFFVEGRSRRHNEIDAAPGESSQRTK